MTGSLNTLFLIIAGLFLLGSIILLFRGLIARSRLSDIAYGVERQGVRREMLVSFTRSAILLLIALTVFAIYGLVPRGEEIESVRSVTPESVTSPTIKASETLSPIRSQTVTRATEVATPAMTAVPDQQDTRASETTQAPAMTLQAQTATVDSFNGLWLRSDPNPESDQLELIPDETVLVVLRGREPANQPEWQQVRSPSGTEGWVFIQYIVYLQDG